MAKKYIPNKSWLTCDKGDTPTQICVTHNNRTSIYGEELASEADVIPGENIKPFGKCSITGSPCAFAPIYWDKCNKGVKVNGFKLVFDDANLLCQQGGKIKVDFDVPTSAASEFFGFTGLGIAIPQWLDYRNVINYNQKGIIYDVENGKLSLVRDNSASDFRRHGNYGEMKSNQYYDDNAFRDIRKEHPVMDIDKPTASGIDGAYEKGGVYRVDDAKYNTAQIQPTNNGRELSKNWVQDHIDKGAISNEADKIAIERANNNGTLERGVSRTNTDGSMRYEPSNDNGFRRGAGATSEITPKPPTKASKLINGVRSSVRNSKPVTALANSNFSKTIQTSKSAIKANNALWKATQYVERTPWLKTTGKVVGKGAIVVGIAIDAFMIGSAYNEEGKFGDKTQQATGSAAGGAAGAWAGAELGAIIGTAICPGIGTVIGGVVGGIIGGIAGSGAGSALVDWMF